MKQVIYFFEGETEKKLLQSLKNEGEIKHGKLKKFNLWLKDFNLERIIKKGDEIFFVIDTDIKNTDIFIRNMELLKPYNICLIVQNKNLEDEICFACGNISESKLLKYFYNVKSVNEFKRRFIKDRNISEKLNKNNFVFDKLWSRGDSFANSINNKVNININCKYRTVKPQKNLQPNW